MTIVCVSLVVLMFVPTLSTGLLSWKNDKPIYQPFPWSGITAPAVVDDEDSVAGPSVPSGAPVGVGPGDGAAKRPMTMEELMKQAAAATADGADAGDVDGAADAGVAGGTPGAKKPLTMEEIMRQANEQLQKDAPSSP